MRFLLLPVLFSALAAGQDAPTGFVRTPEVSIAYWMLGQPGSATPLFAVNGGPGLSHVYMLQNDVWPKVSRTRPVIFYDQRGTGASKVTDNNVPQTMEAQVEDLDAVRAHLHFDKIDVLGDSYGGVLAMAYTAAHPEHVRRLILSDSAAPAWGDQVHLFPQVFPDKLEAQQKNADPEEGLRHHFQLIFYDEEKAAKYLAGAKDLGLAPGVGAAVRRATTKLDLKPALSKFTCPTLVITGRYDMNVAPLTAWKIYKAIPGAKWEVFEKSGHLPYYEEPEKYIRVVEEFLGR